MSNANPVETRGAGLERVLVAGATGKTGRRVASRLADTPVAVRALTRSAANEASLRDRGADEVVVGDLLVPDDAARAVADVDAVVSCVGSSPLAVYAGDVHVDGRGNRNLIAAAEAADVTAFVMLSSLGAGAEPSSLQARFFRLVVGPVVRAKAGAEGALRQADLHYTVLRPGFLLSYGPAGATVAEAGTGLWGGVTRGAVARRLAAAPFTPDAVDRTFEVAGNPFQRHAGLSIDWQLPKT